MAKELDRAGLSSLPVDGDPGAYMIPIAMQDKGWRTFLLDESEKRRMQIIEKNTRSNEVLYRFASRISSVPKTQINSLLIIRDTLTVIPESVN